jgi:hypothetical protein
MQVIQELCIFLIVWQPLQLSAYQNMLNTILNELGTIKCLKRINQAHVKYIKQNN